MASPWIGLRWSQLSNQSAPAGMVLSSPGRLHLLRAVSQTTTGYVMLYDHTNQPSHPILALSPAPGHPDTGWMQPASIPVQHGLYASFSDGGITTLFVGWER